MMSKSRIKNVAIIAGAIASAITLSTFSGFAVGPTTELLTEQTIGISSEIGTSDEQKIGNSVNEEIIVNSKPKVIELSTPGDYRLIGPGIGVYNSDNSNEIIVNINDTILIDGDGKYNVILDNVNIDMNNPIKYEDRNQNAFTIRNKADVNLTLAGKNSLNCHVKVPLNRGWDPENYNGLSVDSTSRLTINGFGKGSSLDVYGEKSGLQGRNIMLNGGTINATGKNDGVNCGNNFGNNLTITDSTINATGRWAGIVCDNLMITGSKINTTGKEVGGISCSASLTINGSTVKATGRSGIQFDGVQSTIIGSTIIAIGDKGHGLHFGQLKVKITDSTIIATSVKNCDILFHVAEMNDSTIVGKTIRGLNNITMNGGKLITDCINDIVLDHNMKETFGRLTKVYGTYDNQGKLVWSKSVNQNDNDCILGYCLPISGISSCIVDANFYITGGTINGVGFKFGGDDEIGLPSLTKKFPAQSSKKEFCDTAIFFDEE